MTNFVEFIFAHSGKKFLLDINKIWYIQTSKINESFTRLYINDDDESYEVKHTYDEVISMISQCDSCIVRLKN